MPLGGTDKMKHFIPGFVLGSVLTAGLAYSAQMVGSNGWLMGWTVTKGGEEICDSPYVWISTKEIECD